MDVTDESFQKDVLDASFKKPVVVDFWAPWCGPCLMLGPIMEQVGKEYSSKVSVVKMNVEENQENATKPSTCHKFLPRIPSTPAQW
jgi:thioredoxin